MSYIERKFLSLNSAGYHRIVYNDWGPKDGNPIIAVHGLTGNGHDFDYLAEELIQDGHRFIAIDLPGRGRSDFLKNSMDYTYNQYWRDLTTLLAHLDLARPQCVDWIGVSLGGLLGMYLAGLPLSPIKRFIINDVGPEVPQAALDFIYHVIKVPYVFNTIQDMEKRMRETRGLTWGPVTDEQWKHMAEHNARGLEDGRLSYSYDPEIARVFEVEPTGALNLWPYWLAAQCPTHLIRGAQSMLLTPEIAAKMQETKPSMAFTEFEGCGHVPSLMAPEQIRVIKEWLTL